MSEMLCGQGGAPNSRCALMPVPTAVPPRASSLSSRLRLPSGDPMDWRICARPAADLLAKPDRHRIHQMGAPGFHHVIMVARFSHQLVV